MSEKEKNDQTGESVNENKTGIVPFKDGELITDGESRICVFKKDCDDNHYMYVHIDCSFISGKLTNVYLDTLVDISDKTFRRASALEKGLYINSMARLQELAK